MMREEGEEGRKVRRRYLGKKDGEEENSADDANSASDVIKNQLYTASTLLCIILPSLAS